MPPRTDPNIPRDLITAAEAAEMLGISRQALHYRIQAGDIACARLGPRAYVFRKAEIRRVARGIGGRQHDGSDDD